MKMNYYKGFFGKVSFIYLKNFECKLENIKKLVDIIDTKYLLTAILALDMKSEFSNRILSSEQQYKTILPIKNTITSETMITALKQDFLSVLELLVESKPRCITLYGLKNETEFCDSQIHLKFQDVKAEYLVSNNLIDYVISVNIDETIVIITINSNVISPTKFRNGIKEIF